MAKTWKELRAEGVKRCCAIFYNRRTKLSRQCRRRAAHDNFCEKHQWVDARLREESRRIAVLGKRAKRKEGN